MTMEKLAIWFIAAAACWVVVAAVVTAIVCTVGVCE